MKLALLPQQYAKKIEIFTLYFLKGDFSVERDDSF